MEQNEKYLYATAPIDGEIKEFYRKGKKPEPFFYKIYDNREIKGLESSIQDSLHLIKLKLDRVGYFYSDDFSFCNLYLPDVICALLKIEFKTNVEARGQFDNFIIFTDKIDYLQAGRRFNEHFEGNLY
ncbi:hypothetical protein G9F72_018805 [Clostridium estertheticum]|uniref:hypothetical protein n=1 Tax=Clostridium estertheticum TaxID=238834 RepID=UPI0013E8F6B2|nr:hypothetical protein [Clostridium estertheticum]MBZ9688383.1 hypothetical protein [Clostridium estertheticum]